MWLDELPGDEALVRRIVITWHLWESMLTQPLVTWLRRARASLAPMGSHGLHHRSTRFDYLASYFGLSRRMATNDGIPWKLVRTSLDGWRRVCHGLLRKDGRIGARLG